MRNYNQLFCEKIPLFTLSIIIFNDAKEETIIVAIKTINIEKKFLPTKS